MSDLTPWLLGLLLLGGLAFVAAFMLAVTGDPRTSYAERIATDADFYADEMGRAHDDVARVRAYLKGER